MELITNRYGNGLPDIMKKIYEGGTGDDYNVKLEQNKWYFFIESGASSIHFRKADGNDLDAGCGLFGLFTFGANKCLLTIKRSDNGLGYQITNLLGYEAKINAGKLYQFKF